MFLKIDEESFQCFSVVWETSYNEHKNTLISAAFLQLSSHLLFEGRSYLDLLLPYHSMNKNYKTEEIPAKTLHEQRTHKYKRTLKLCNTTCVSFVLKIF